MFGNNELICLYNQNSCNGECDKITGHCICPSNGYWIDDTSIFLYQNCSMPKWFLLFVNSMSIICSISLQIYVMLFYYKKHGYAKKVIRYVSIANVSMTIASISHLTFGGTNVVFWIFLSIVIFSISSGFATYIVAFGTLNFSVTKMIVPERSFQALYYFCVTSVTLPCVFFALFGSIYFGFPQLSSYNKVSYNNIVALFIVSLPIQLLITGPVLIYISNTLVSSIVEIASEDSPDIEQQQAMKKKNNLSLSRTFSKIDFKSDISIQSIVRRLMLLRNMIIFCIAPIEIILCIGTSLLHYFIRFQYMYIFFLLFIMVLQGTIALFIVVSGRESSKISVITRAPSNVLGRSRSKSSNKSKIDVISSLQSSPIRKSTGTNIDLKKIDEIGRNSLDIPHHVVPCSSEILPSKGT